TLLLSILILGDRQGGHLHGLIGSLPIYITEAVLAALILRYFIVFFISPGRRKLIEYPWVGFYAVAAFSAVRGLLLYRPLQVVRDSALVYYSFFTHLLQNLL